MRGKAFHCYEATWTGLSCGSTDFTLMICCFNQQQHKWFYSTHVQYKLNNLQIMKSDLQHKILIVQKQGMKMYLFYRFCGRFILISMRLYMNTSWMVWTKNNKITKGVIDVVIAICNTFLIFCHYLIKYRVITKYISNKSSLLLLLNHHW